MAKLAWERYLSHWHVYRLHRISFFSELAGLRQSISMWRFAFIAVCRSCIPVVSQSERGLQKDYFFYRAGQKTPFEFQKRAVVKKTSFCEFKNSPFQKKPHFEVATQRAANKVVFFARAAKWRFLPLRKNLNLGSPPTLW